MTKLGRHTKKQENMGTFAINEGTMFKVLALFAATLVFLFCLCKGLYALGYISEDIFFLFHMDRENNVPTWYSTVQLFTVGLVCLILTLKNAHNNAPGTHILFWICMAAGFCLLSLDEMVSLHEKFDRHYIMGVKLQYRWVIYFLPIVIVGMSLFFVSANRVLKENKETLLKISIGLCALFGAAMGLEMLKPIIFASPTLGNIPGILTLQVIIEEFTEIISVSYILKTLMTYSNNLGE